jgi:hypothetical protein
LKNLSLKTRQGQICVKIDIKTYQAISSNFKHILSFADEEPIAAATFSEVEGHGSLSVGPGPGGDAEAEGTKLESHLSAQH